jgi:hypothetical protein
MKAITTCAPLLLILAIGCDDSNEPIELTNETNQSRWEPAQGEEIKVVQNDSASRAAHMTKAHRAITQLMTKEVLNPYANVEQMDALTQNCTFEKNPELVTTQSACARMPQDGYEIEVVECNIGNDETYSGTLIVSTDVIAHLDEIDPPGSEIEEDFLKESLQSTSEWYLDVQLESADGTMIEACGDVSTSARKNASHMILNVTHPTETNENGDKLRATYEATALEAKRGFKRTVIQSELHLLNAEAPHLEVEHIRTRGIYKSSSLQPQFGAARLTGQHSGLIRFNARRFAPDVVAFENVFQSTKLVEVPKL